ncbi:MAG TPA: hypothetical protein VGO93_28520, partial [Candidatus Xenobia bacterium]
MTNSSVKPLQFAATGTRVPEHAPAASTDNPVDMAIKDERGPSLGARIATAAMGGLALAGGAGALTASAQPVATVTVQQDSKFFMNPGASAVGQNGLPMVPSVVPAVLHVVNNGEQAPASGVFIGSESRSGVSDSSQSTTSLADLSAKFDNVSFQRGGFGGGKPHEKGFEKGREKGREKGEEKGREKGREKGEEKGREKGQEKGHEKGHEKGQEKGREKGQEKSHEKGNEKSAEHPTQPTRPTPPPQPGHPTRPTPNPAPRPLPPGPAPRPGRPSTPKAPPTHTVKDGGHKYKIPEGGWVTQAHRDHPDIKTGRFDRDHDRDWRNQIVDVRHWHDHDFGHDWYHHDHGFYDGNAFWFGFEMGQFDSWDWNAQPVYVV